MINAKPGGRTKVGFYYLKRLMRTIAVRLIATVLTSTKGHFFGFGDINNYWRKL